MEQNKKVTMDPLELFRAPLISIEGIRNYRNALVAEKLTDKIEGQVRMNFAFEEGTTSIGSLLRRHSSGSLQLSDLVFYQLRNANLWENQFEIESLLKNYVTVIVTDYVSTNRAKFLSKGTVSPEFCYQLDEHLLKPDLQIYLKGPPIPLEVYPSVSEKDTRDSRKKLVESFDHLAKISDEIKTIDVYSRNCRNLQELSDLSCKLTIDLFNETKFTKLNDFIYFNGYE